MGTAVIIDAVRTAGGKRNGKLRDWHPVDLAAETLKALVERNQRRSRADRRRDHGLRHAGRRAGREHRPQRGARRGLPRDGAGDDRRPSVRVVAAVRALRRAGRDRRCVRHRDRGRRRGHDPRADGRVLRRGQVRHPVRPDGQRPLRRRSVASCRRASRPSSSPRSGASAARSSTRSRPQSQQRAAQATDEGRFQNEIVAVKGADGDPVVARRGHPPGHHGRVARQAEAVVQGGRQGHGRQLGQITDGASAVLIMSEEKANQLGLKPRARFVSFALAGADPRLMLTGADPRDRRRCSSGPGSRSTTSTSSRSTRRSRRSCWRGRRSTTPTWSKVNVNGGAIALGHPLGCSGAKLMATLLNELERTGGRYGLQTMCEGGGMANATIIERL